MGKLVTEYTFIDLNVEGDILVSGKVDGVDVSEHAADTGIHQTHGNLANLNLVNQNVGSGGAPTFAGLTVNGNVAVNGTVDGVDVSVHAENTAIHHTHANKANLDLINQGLGSASTPAFGGMTVNGNVTVTGTVDGVDIAAHAADSTIHNTPANKAYLDTINQNLGTANAATFAGLTVNGNMAVTGTVDGVDVSAHAGNTAIHHSHANKANLDVVNQSLATTAAPAFAGMTVNGNVAVTGTVDGVDISAHVADATLHQTHANKANLDTINQNLGMANAAVFAGLTVNGNMAVTGTVDGVDVSAHAGDTTIHHSHVNKANLDAMNQSLATTAAPAFAGMTVNGNLAVTGNVDGVKVSGHGARHQAGGADALTGSLDANARVQVKAAGTTVGTRRAINFIAGDNVTLSVSDNSAGEAVNVTISAVGASSSPSVAGPETVPGVAGEAMAAYDLCYLKNDGKYYKTNSLAVATMPGLVLASKAFTIGQAGDFIRRGQVSNAAWAFASVGGFVYAGNMAGTLTQTLPSKSGEQLQIVGIAKGATLMDFEPNLLLVEVA